MPGIRVGGELVERGAAAVVPVVGNGDEETPGDLPVTARSGMAPDGATPTAIDACPPLRVPRELRVAAPPNAHWTLTAGRSTRSRLISSNTVRPTVDTIVSRPSARMTAVDPSCTWPRRSRPRG